MTQDDINLKILLNKLGNCSLTIENNYPLDYFSGDNCPYCGSNSNNIKKGKRKRKLKGDVQVYKCKRCGHKFSERERLPRTKFPKQVLEEVIRLAVNGLKPARIAGYINTKQQNEIRITRQTVVNLIKKATKTLNLFEILLLRYKSLMWQIDDMLQKHRSAYITNVLDPRTKYWLSSNVSEKRDTNASIKALQLALLRFKFPPKMLVCDGFQGHISAARKVCPESKLVSKTKEEDFSIVNEIENLHSWLRQNGVPRSGTFRSAENLQAYLDLLRIYRNFFCPLEVLGGKTPAQAVGVSFSPKLGWINLIKLANFYVERYSNKCKNVLEVVEQLLSENFVGES